MPKDRKRRKESASQFGKKIAKVMLDLKSSHCYFILQRAYGEDLSWTEAEEIMKEVLNAR